MNAALLQLLLLLSVLYAKEKFLPNLALLTKKKSIAASIGGDGATRVDEEESMAAQAKQPSSRSVVEPSSSSAPAFGLKRIEQDLAQVNEKLDRISNDVNAQYQAIDQKIHTLDVDLQQQGVFIQTNVDDSDEISVATSPLLSKIDERFQELMDKLEEASNKNQQAQTQKAGGDDDESTTNMEIMMQNVTTELKSSLEAKMNQVSQNVRALSLGFVAAVTIALATVALPRVVDVMGKLMATIFDDED